MVRRQRVCVTTRGGGVLEGRDIGTVVFPDADLKVYLTADPDVRAQRRSKEVTDLDYATVAADMARRDALDSGREASPLTQAPDAFHLDTSGMTVEELIDVLSERVKTSGLRPAGPRRRDMDGIPTPAAPPPPPL